MKLVRILALIKKEASQTYKDPSSIITAFIFPLVLLILYGYGVSLDMIGIKIGVVMEDTSSLARGFVRSLLTTRYFKTQTLSGIKEAKEKITSGEVQGIVVVPAYFSEYFNNKSEIAPIQVIADGTSPNTAQFVQNYVRGAWTVWQQDLSKEEEISPPLLARVIPRIRYNDELRSSFFLVPGSIAVIMTVTGTLLTSFVIAREWERGTMESLMSTPVSMGEIVISKLITYFCLGIAAMIVCFLTARYIYEIPFRGSFFALVLTSSAYLAFALGMGMLISISVHDQFAASQIAIVSTYLPAFILSGFIFDISSMPLYLRVLTNFVPARYFVENLKTLFLVGDVWSIILPNTLFMAMFAAAIYFMIGRKCIKRLD